MQNFFIDQRLMIAGVRRPGVDGHRRLHHGQDGQFRDLRERKRIMATSHGPTILGDRRRHGGEHPRRRRDASPCWSRSMPRPRSRDPMAKRVKALNERREQLKAGIVASTSQAPQEHHQPATRWRTRSAACSRSLKVLQEEPGHEGAGQADAGRHPLQGPRLRRHLRAAGAADRARRLRRSSLVYWHRLFPRLGRRSRNTGSSPAR